jgi:uncharacterized protein
MSPPRSPWREPMVWLIVALPLLSIIGCIALIVVAAG